MSEQIESETLERYVSSFYQDLERFQHDFYALVGEDHELKSFDHVGDEESTWRFTHHYAVNNIYNTRSRTLDAREDGKVIYALTFREPPEYEENERKIPKQKGTPLKGEFPTIFGEYLLQIRDKKTIRELLSPEQQDAYEKEGSDDIIHASFVFGKVDGQLKLLRARSMPAHYPQSPDSEAAELWKMPFTHQEILIEEMPGSMGDVEVIGRILSVFDQALPKPKTEENLSS